MDINWVTFGVFLFFFGIITLLGFIAARWRRGDLNKIDEWGLGGRRFGTVVTWFLLGGDLYTAYTFLAVPALIFGAGAMGFFAVPYAIIAYPLAFIILPRLWAVARKHNYVTAADFVQGRFGSKGLALIVALIGMVATMPYIALQLVGLQVTIAALGFDPHGPAGEWPLIVGFVVLAAFTYNSGLRAPALIAIVKDLLIYITVIAAVVVIPMSLGGFEGIFAAVPPEKLLLGPPTEMSLGPQSAFATLALGSALGLFLYPHSLTGVLSSTGRKAIRRNAALLPAYSLLLGFIALLGYMALASGVDKMPEYASFFAEYGANFAVPALFLHSFSDWFAGIAFAALGIGALVPAAVMAIAAANLFTRNVYKPFVRPNCSQREESQAAKIFSLLVKFGALIFIVGVPQEYAIQLQLLGGIFIIQTLPAVFLGLYTRWFDGKALALGCLVGMGLGVSMAIATGFKSIYVLDIFGYQVPCYAALSSFLVNLLVAILATVILRALKIGHRRDETVPADYV